MQMLRPFCEEIEQLQLSGITHEDSYFQVQITHAVFDLPARAQIQNMMQYNGKNACPYCIHPGVSIDGRIKYTNSHLSPAIRTHENTLKTMMEIEEKGDSRKKAINGKQFFIFFQN